LPVPVRMEFPSMATFEIPFLISHPPFCEIPASRPQSRTSNSGSKQMKRLITLLAAGALSIAAGAANAGADFDKIKQSGEFRIGTEGTYAPFTYHDANNQLVGFDVEIGREIAKRLGVEAKFQEGKWDGLIAGLDADRYDAVINQDRKSVV